MGLDDRAADGKPDAHAGFLGREEGLEQVGLRPRRNAVARYRTRRSRPCRRPPSRVDAISSRRGDCAIASSALRNRLTSTCWIWTRSTSTRSHCGSSSNRSRTPCSRAPARPSAPASSISLREAFDALLDLAARDEIAQPADDLAGAQRLLGGAIQRPLDLRRVGIGAAGQQPARTLHVVADRGKRLVELMRQRRGHLAHRGQARDMDQFGLQFLQPGLGLLMLGQVADETGEVGLAVGLHFADRQLHRKGRAVLALAGHDPPDADDVPLAGAIGNAPGNRRGGRGRARASVC